MANRNKSVILVSLLVLTAILISACTQPYSNVPLETPTANPTNLFVSPIATTDNPMDMIGEFATSTALAETAVALTAGTPAVTKSSSSIEITPGSNVTTTPGNSAVVPTSTPTISVVVPSATQQLPAVTTNRPASYTLKQGEFPYCIARRFNIDPEDLLNANNLASGDVYYPNLTLTIPQSSNPFPGARSLNSRPATYTVPSADTTIYAVACHYGDIDPATIAQANNLQLTATLTVGQQLTIP